MSRGYRTSKEGDEFYTKREDVDMMLEQYLDIFSRQGCKILCPCDTSESAYVRFFLEHEVDVAWSDKLDYDSFDFSAFDFVVTNPPFSMMGAFMKKIADSCCGGHIVMPRASLVDEACERLLQRGWIATDEGVPTEFVRPDLSTMTGPGIVVLRSPDFASNEHAGSIRRERIAPEKAASYAELTQEGITRFSRTSAVPDRWHGLIAVPITWVPIRYDPKLHEIIGHQGFHRLDGSETFNSFIVRCIDEAK